MLLHLNFVEMMSLRKYTNVLKILLFQVNQTKFWMFLQHCRFRLEGFLTKLKRKTNAQLCSI